MTKRINRIIILILIVFCFSCAKKVEIQKIDDHHWKFNGSSGVKVEIDEQKDTVIFDTNEKTKKFNLFEFIGTFLPII